MASLIMWIAAGPLAAAATAAGGVMAIGNYFLLVRDVNKITTTSDPKPYGFFWVRFMLMGTVLFAMIALLKMNPIGVIIGVTMIIPGVVSGMVLGWKS